MARTCKINPQGGPVTVTLAISNALISGGDFKIYDFNGGHVNETFKINTSTAGNGSYDIKISPRDLIGQVLSWQTLTCSPIVTDKGVLTIVVSQDNAPCDTTPPATYTLTGVPNCSIGQAIPVSGGLHFISNN